MKPHKARKPRKPRRQYYARKKTLLTETQKRTLKLFLRRRIAENTVQLAMDRHTLEALSKPLKKGVPKPPPKKTRKKVLSDPSKRAQKGNRLRAPKAA